jgi:hypothetical protein
MYATYVFHIQKTLHLEFSTLIFSQAQFSPKKLGRNIEWQLPLSHGIRRVTTDTTVCCAAKAGCQQSGVLCIFNHMGFNSQWVYWDVVPWYQGAFV